MSLRGDSVSADLKRKIEIIAKVRNETLHDMVNIAVEEWFKQNKVELQKELETFFMNEKKHEVP